MVDSQRLAKEAVTAIGACLDPPARETDPHRLYVIQRHWYRNASAWMPKPSQTNMEKFRGEFKTLYHREEQNTPGIPLATHMEPFQVNDLTHKRMLRRQGFIAWSSLRQTVPPTSVWRITNSGYGSCTPGRTRRPP